MVSSPRRLISHTTIKEDTMAPTVTRREQGPPTSCHNVAECGASGIYGFDVVDTDHGIHRVLCTDCAREAVEATTTELRRNT